MVGRMIKLDRSTSIYDKGGFARICVEIDLQQPLLPSYSVFGEELPIVYEGLHQVCFECGKYGHKKDRCPTKLTKDDEQVHEKCTEIVDGKSECVVGGEGGNTKEVDVVSGEVLSSVIGDGVSNGCPFGKIKILRREFGGSSKQADLIKDSKGNKRADQRIGKDVAEFTQQGLKKDIIKGSSGLKGDTLKERAPSKSEWVKVGSKRKNSNKSKLKGKEGRVTSCDFSHNDLEVGRGVQGSQGNSFGALQQLDPTASCSLDSRPIVGDSPTVAAPITSTSQPIINSCSEKGVPSSDLSPSSLGGLDIPMGMQDHGPKTEQQGLLDEIMVEQDKTEGEVNSPKRQTTVS
ncbi:hypothetical protein K1719_031126 [Acacia pycnantha]|nr:hypothetical protein K1719_031126 [Acacia pycnantha]